MFKVERSLFSPDSETILRKIKKKSLTGVVLDNKKYHELNITHSLYKNTNIINSHIYILLEQLGLCANCVEM